MQRSIRSIVVGSASVDRCELAVSVAAGVASREGAALHVVHAYDLPDPIQAAYARELFLDPSVLDRYGDELRTRLEIACGEVVRDCEATFHAVEGSAGESLSELGAEVGADLVVVGASRGDRLWQPFLGTTAEGVIRHSRSPVLVLRRPLAQEGGRVLLTTDLTPGSAAVHARALPLVHALFGGTSPAFRCLLAVQADTLPLDMGGGVLERVAERELRSFLDRGPGAGTALETRVRVGTPAPEILGEAAEWQADLLVLGAHGRRSGHGLLLGSVAGSVLRGTSTNVLVLPPVPAPDPRTSRRPIEAHRAVHASLPPRSRSARQRG